MPVKSCQLSTRPLGVLLFCIKVHIFEEINVLFDVISTPTSFETNTEEILQTVFE
jgi:hypothetical protein